MSPKKDYPYEIRNVSPDEEKIINKCLTVINNEVNKTDVLPHVEIGYTKGFIKCGPEGYIMPKKFKKYANIIYNMEVRPDDVWVITFPRSGTTWTQEMVWLLENDLNFEKAKAKPLYDRFPMLEITSQVPELGNLLIKANFLNLGNFQGLYSAVRTPSWETIDNVPSPRYIKTHLPLSMLPPNLLNTAKVVYVARDPRDVAVSYFYLHKLVGKSILRATFKDFWEAFRRDLLPWTPVISHANEAWQHKDNPNLHFIFYEDLKKDLSMEIRKMSKFLGRHYNDIQVQRLNEHLSFDNFQKNKNVNNVTNSKDKQIQFVRKGETGGWVKYFDEKMSEQAEHYLREKLKKVDIRYPSISLDITCSSTEWSHL